MQINSTALNKLALDLLKQLGNRSPSSRQIKLMLTLIEKLVVPQHLIFHERLSPREIICLLFAAQGKTSQETAVLLKLKRSSVDTYRKSILRKLDCATIAEAIFKGMRYGLLNHELTKPFLPISEECD